MAASDARPVPRKNAAWRVYFAIRKSDGTLITSWTGADSEVSKDGGSFADCTDEATEVGTSGCGYLDLSASEMNADAVTIKITVTNTGALPLVLTVFPEEAGDYRIDTTNIDAIKAKTDTLPVDPADASDIAASFATVNMKLDTIDDFLDTEVAAIKAKTDNLPSDPADASDIASSFSTVNSTLATIAAYIDTEVAAIKAKTDNLPVDPADQSAVEAAISAAIATVPTAAQNAYAVWDEEMADHTGSTTYGSRIVRASNSNVTVQITGSNHIASDVHAFQADVIDATAFASSAVAEIQSGLATSTALTSVASDVTGIKAKTDNLPADPADASDIASSFASISSTLSTIASYIDTEVSAIKAKTDNLPSDPADQSAVEAAITAATSVLATAASLATVASELAKVHKQGETRRFTQVAANAGAKTADVTMGAPL